MQPGAGVDRLLYLYGVVPTGQCCPSHADVPLQIVSQASVAAVVEPVCAREFAPETLDEKLQSLEWVARLARRHEAVLEWAMRQGAVVPARLCTLFSTSEALRCSLSDHEARFLAALKRLHGREEWGLKAFCDERQLRAALVTDDPELRILDAVIAGANPGHAFVLRKKRDAWAAELASGRLDALVDDVLESVDDMADDVRLRPLLPTSASGRDELMPVNAALLVKVGAREALREVVAGLSARFHDDGLVFELSGPWPAYSFCDDTSDRGANVEGEG